MPAPKNEPVIFVIDADPAARRELLDLAREMNLACRAFGTCEDFFAKFDPEQAGCLILAVQSPALSGLQVQQRLAERKSALPLIVIGRAGDVSLTVELLRRGAVNFLVGPPRKMDLWSAIEDALAIDRQRRRSRYSDTLIEHALTRLTPRQRQLLHLLAEGLTNQQVAQEIGISIRTVELERTRIMRQFKLASPAALVHFALLLHPQGPFAKLKDRVAVGGVNGGPGGPA